MASSDDVVVRVGFDSSEFEAGAQRAGQALKKFEAQAGSTGGRIPIVNQKLAGLSNTLFALTGVSGGASRALTVVAHSANLLQQASMGLVSGWGLALTALTTLGVAIYNYTKTVDEAKKATVALGESAKDLHDQAIAAQDLLPQTDPESVSRRLKARIAEMQAFLMDMRGLQAKLIAENRPPSEHVNKLVTDAAAALKGYELELQALQVRVLLAGSTSLHKFLQDARAALEDMPIPEDKPAKFKPPELLPARPFGENVPRYRMVNKAQLEALRREQEEFHKLQEKAMAELQEGWANISHTMARDLIDVFSAGEQGFQRMLQRWASMLAEAAVFSALMSLFNPGASFGSFFKGFFGFQHGAHDVQKTGLALVHRGEQIVPAGQNVFTTTRQQNITSGDMTVIINNYGADTKRIVRDIEDLSRQRRTALAWSM